ncbi:MAG: hypothetical protein NUV49_02335 [Patescibacteria group bacterium]|nr:hypothetical protein [Patescibacteria group bacterium]
MLTVMPGEGTICNGVNCSKKVAPREFVLRIEANGEPIYFCSSVCAYERVHKDPVSVDFIADWATGQTLAA